MRVIDLLNLMERYERVIVYEEDNDGYYVWRSADHGIEHAGVLRDLFPDKCKKLVVYAIFHSIAKDCIAMLAKEPEA